MFTYFYNIFRPVNRMYFTKCCVNIALHNSDCCIRSVALCITVFITTHSIHKEGDILQNLLLCDISRNKAPRADPHHICRTVCSFFGRERTTDGRADELAILLWRLLLRLSAAAVVVPLILPPKIVSHIASLGN